jgi:hypothetical protein
VRRLEKKLNDLSMQLEDERRHVADYKEQAERADARAKQLRRQLDENESEIEALKSKQRKHQRDFNDLQEAHDTVNRENQKLRTTARFVLLWLLCNRECACVDHWALVQWPVHTTDWRCHVGASAHKTCSIRPPTVRAMATTVHCLIRILSACCAGPLSCCALACVELMNLQHDEYDVGES